METPSGKVGSGRRRRILRIGALVAVIAVVLAALAWLFTPRLTETLLLRQLDRVEERTGLSIDVDSFQTKGRDGVELRGFVISLPDSDTPLGRIDELDAAIDLLQAVRGRPVITAVDVRGVEFVFDRRADGSDDINDILATLGGGDEPDDEREEATDSFDGVDDAINAQIDRILRHFGDRYPDVIVRDAVVEFTHDADVKPWPLRRLSIEELLLEGDSRAAHFVTAIDVDAPEGADLRLPTHVDISGTLRRPIEESTIAIDLNPDIRIANLRHLPFTEFSLTGFAVTDRFTVEVTELKLASRLYGVASRLASAERIRARLSSWPTSPRDLSIVELEVETPRLFVEYDARGASNLTELYTLVRQPTANVVTSTARAISDSIELSALDDDGLDELTNDQSEPLGLADRLSMRIGEFPIQTFLMEYLPQQTTLRDIRLVVEDRRAHEDLTAPAAQFELAGEVMELQHQPLQGLIEGTFNFHTKADDHVGTADLQFQIPYRRGDWNASIDIDEIELSHFSQLGGRRLARYLHGGEITATLDIRNDGNADGSATHFDGLFAVRRARVYLPALAEDPIELSSASVFLDGFYDPSMAVPPPELIRKGYSIVTDEDDTDEDEMEIDPDAPPPPPDRGAFVINDAQAQIADLEATFGFAVYGIDGFRLPNRTTLSVDLDTTPLNTIIDSIPAALRGPLDGLEMIGDLTWKFDLEVPLHNASDMAWDARVHLSDDIEVVQIPEAVDVFRLTEEFEHTIRDEWTKEIANIERDFFYERTITIPPMQPTPATWFLDNTSLDLEALDKIRREREWPEVPEWHKQLGLTQQELDDPEFWLTAIALDTAAEYPWYVEPEQEEHVRAFWDNWGASDDADDSDDFDDYDEDILVYEKPDPPEFSELEINADSERYGPYVYVPLHHISPYVVRAIMTTEDTSFFTHRGFNYLAIRQSAETNINAGRYVRGASTISMQLAKNLFLDRSRVLSRKFQEVALVWLMESVAEIPKERMMEVYLNIIEFGPGVFGINEAAVHYFGKQADQLTISEVAWLVSIVPSPKRHHEHYERGEINNVWFHRMSRYIRAMKWRERISEEEMEAALEDRPQFYIPEDGEPVMRADAGEDLGEIDPDDLDLDAADDETEVDEARRFRLPLFD